MRFTRISFCLFIIGSIKVIGAHPTNPTLATHNSRSTETHVVCTIDAANKQTAPKNKDFDIAITPFLNSSALCATVNSVCPKEYNNLCVGTRGVIQLAQYGSATIEISGLKGKMEMPCGDIAKAMLHLALQCQFDHQFPAGEGRVAGYADFNGPGATGWGRVTVRGTTV